MLQKVKVEGYVCSEKTNVVAIFLAVSFQFREGEIVWIERHQPKMAIGSWKHLHEPLFVVFGNHGDGYAIKVDKVLSCKQPSSATERQHDLSSFAWREVNDIHIGRRAT